MIELRWAVPPETTTAPPVLQYRQTLVGAWSDWQTVPRVVVPSESEPLLSTEATTP